MGANNLCNQVRLVTDATKREFGHYVETYTLKSSAIMKLFKPRIFQGREKFELYIKLHGQLKLEDERKRAYACRDKYVGVSNDGSAAGGASFSSRGGSSRYGSVSYDDPYVPSSRSREEEDADSRWGMSGGDTGADDSVLPEPEPLPETVAPPTQTQKNMFDTEFSEPVAAKPAPAQTTSLFDSLDTAPAPAPSNNTSFFGAPAAAPAPAASTNTMSFFDMAPAAAAPAPAPARAPAASTTNTMSFFDMAPAAAAPAPAPAPATTTNPMSFFDMSPAPATTTSTSSTAFAFPAATPAAAPAPAAQAAAPAKKDDIWGGLVNLDSLGSSSSSSASPAKSSAPMGGSAASPSKMSMSAMSSTGPAMRPMGSTAMQPSSSTMSFTGSTTPMQPTRGPNYDALKQPQYNPYMQQQQMLRMQQMQQMQMQQRYTGAGYNGSGF